MKIGIDVRVLMDNYYSGVSIFTLNLLNNLLKIDKSNTYHFFCNSFRRKNINLPNKNIVQTFYPNKIFNYLMQKYLAWPKLDKVLGDPDIFYSPHINFSSISKSTKKIMTIHDLSFLRYPDFFNARKNFWHKAINISKNIKNFDKIIAVSENTKNDIVELLGVDEQKIEVVYPGISCDLLSENDFSSDFLSKNYNIDRSYILYLGTIEPRKNIVNLIKAYNLLRDSGFEILLVLVGSWGWKTKDIRMEWESSKYKNDIRFIGYIPENEKKPFYSGASLFVYPSFYEGFGFPPLEAMYFSIPVIAGNTSSLPEVLNDSALLINPDDFKDLFEAMRAVLSDNRLKENLMEKAKKRLDFFSWNKTAENYLRIFKEVYDK